MTVRRSSRRSIVGDKEESSAQSLYVATRVYNKKNVEQTEAAAEKKLRKKTVVDVVSKQHKEIQETEIKPKRCDIKLYRLQASKGDYSQDDIAETQKMSKEAKNLLIARKKGKTLVPLQRGVKKRGREPKGGGGKFQLKIKHTEDSQEEREEEEEEADDEDKERPDSGFSSRAGTDTPRSLSESPAKEELNADMERENQKFLAELDEGLTSEEEEEESDWDGDSDDGFKKAAKKPAKRTKKQLKAKAALSAPIVMPGAMKTELSEYEKLRMGNIKDRQEMLAALMADFADFKKDSGLGPKTGGVKRKRREKIDFNPDQLRRSTRQSIKPEDREKLGSERWDVDTGSRHRLAEEYSDYDSDDYEIYEKRSGGATKKVGRGRGNLSKDPNVDVLMPEDITETMLSKVADRFGQKVYNQEIGTSCHQCRQKTVDMKTVCRSGRCLGVRGQFCGRCLEIRSGGNILQYFAIFCNILQYFALI